MKKRDRPKDIVDRIENEFKSYEAQQNVRRFRPDEPLPVLNWTKKLDGYAEARLSAENAKRRIVASTPAARAAFEAGHPESVILERFFFKVRDGSIQANSREIVDMLQWAGQIGGTQAFLFIQRLAEELKNARKRVTNAPHFNEFRDRIATYWLRYGFWLMSDDLIACVATTLKFRPLGCTRQTISRAVKELKLVKHRQPARRPLIIGWDENGFVFREGYPPKS
jgi:hypothetical protein